MAQDCVAGAARDAQAAIAKALRGMHAQNDGQSLRVISTRALFPIGMRL